MLSLFKHELDPLTKQAIGLRCFVAALLAGGAGAPLMFAISKAVRLPGVSRGYEGYAAAIAGISLFGLAFISAYVVQLMKRYPEDCPGPVGALGNLGGGLVLALGGFFGAKLVATQLGGAVVIMFLPAALGVVMVVTGACALALRPGRPSVEARRSDDDDPSPPARPTRRRRVAAR